MSLMPKGNFLEKLVPILLVASIGLAFAVGMLWKKVQNLEGGSNTKVVGAGAAEANKPQAVQAQTATKGVASVNDDPKLVDK